ncbi:dead end protein homolog 1 isoform X3 [Parus major]|uniref:dead end protein homolog 1 isoform X3 n=1 Tax=Parus major TaxID=9157 RepID=UPI0007713E4C|nr:dead end protein homolog 1 isoform X3 [Parus major]
MLLHNAAWQWIWQFPHGVGMLPAGRLKALCSHNHRHHLLLQMWSSGINEAGKMALLAWEKETGIELVQINGQRHYGGPPPGWVGGPPPVGTEVYIARLPQDVYENTLIPLFESVGKLYEFRLMLTFSGLNRGFAYARYASWQCARSAIATFHRFQLREGCAIVVCWSTQKRELLMNGLAASVSQQELEARLQVVTEGICSVTLYTSPRQRQAKLAVLKYRSHKAAAQAKKILMEGNLRLGEAGMKVDWLDPRLKQKLQPCEEEPSSSWAQGSKSLEVPRLTALPLSLQNLLEHLNMVCWKHRLRTPLFIIRVPADLGNCSARATIEPEPCWGPGPVPASLQVVCIGLQWLLSSFLGSP